MAASVESPGALANAHASRVFSWVVKRWGTLETFRRLAKAGIPIMKPALQEKCRKIVAGAESLGLYDVMFKKEGMTPAEAKVEFLNAIGGFGAMADQMAGYQITQHDFAVDAACLIFAHTIVDAAVAEHCRVISLVSPLHLERLVGRKTVALEEVRESGYEQLVRGKVEEYLDALDRRSLMEKVGILHDLCRPNSDFARRTGCVYDQERLQKLDRIRHDIVHGREVATPLPEGDDDLKFLHGVCNYFFLLVNQQYGVKLDPDSLGMALAPGAGIK